MKHAEHLGVRDHATNPCRRLRKRGYKFVPNPLEAPEYERLGKALVAKQDEQPICAALIYFLGLTGARVSEAVGLKWRNISGLRAMLEDSKEGPRTIWLSRPVQSVLESVPKTPGQRYVFGTMARSRLAYRLARFWNELKKVSGLRLRLHDLRHGFASLGVNEGTDLRVVGQLLGHKDFNSTLVYAHLNTRALHEAANRIGKVIQSKTTPPAAPT